MKTLNTLLIAGFALLLSVGVAQAVELDDLDVTIRVIDSDDVGDIGHELMLPFPVPGSGGEHAEDAGHDSDEGEQVASNQTGNDTSDRDERGDDDADNRDESLESSSDAQDERDDADDEERSEDQQEQEDETKQDIDGDTETDSSDIPGTPDEKTLN